MTAEETEMMARLIATNEALAKRLLHCTCASKAPELSHASRSGNAARQARYREKHRNTVTQDNAGSNGFSVTNNGVVSSYKRDLEREKEPSRALSPTLSNLPMSVTRSVTKSVMPVTVTSVTQPALRDAINPESQDRDWRKMIRAGAS